MQRAALRLALAAAVLSGAAALVYEVVWLRMLGLVVGHAVDALTAVLAAFMAGLALGAALFGRFAGRLRNPLAACAWLEGGVGAYAVLLPLALAALPQVTLPLRAALGWGYDGFSLTQTALACALLLPPTVLMGGTLPLLSQAAGGGHAAPARVAGVLYALNTCGAVLGVLAAGYWLLPAAGNRATVWIAAGANLAAAALLLAASRRPAGDVTASVGRVHDAEGSSGPPERSLRPNNPAWLFPAAMAVSGAAAMVLQVALTRALSLVIGSSTYAFTAVLVVVLTGIAAGSAVYTWRWGARPAGPAALGVIEAGIGGLTAWALLGFERLPDFLLQGLRWSTAPGWVALLQLILSAAILLPAMLLVGASLPCALSATVIGGSRVGRQVGRLYAANTAGAVAGVILGGLVLIPAWGVHAALKTAIVATLLLAAALLAVSGRRLPRRLVPAAASVVAAAAVALAPAWDSRVMSSAPAVYAKSYLGAGEGRRLREIVAEETVLFYRDGRSGTVAVTRVGPQTLLRINGKIDAGTVRDMPTQLMAAHLPLLLHPAPRTVFILGLGSGMTAAAAARHPVERVDVLEIEPAVVEASRFFAGEQDGALADPRVRVLIGDGRSFLQSAGPRYDVIISEPSNPWIQGMAGLFSAEFFALARERLRPGGMMLQWVQSYNLAPDDLKMVVATFRGAFPAASVWEPTPGDFLLLGSAEPAPLDLTRLRARWEALAKVQADFERLGIRGWAGMLGFFALREDDAARLGAGAGINTDDRLPLEFSAPRSLYVDTSMPNQVLIGWFRRASLPELTPESAREIEGAESRYWIGVGCLRRGAPADALVQFERALAFEPSHAPSALGASTAALQLGRPADALAFARRALAREPAQPTALFLAGASSWWLGQTSEAGRFFERAVALEPQNAEFRGALERFRRGTLSR